MFCTKCGSRVPDASPFCSQCGTPAVRPDLPSQTALSDVRCAWCGAEVDRTHTSCPKCGGTIRQPAGQAESGWVQLPGRPDMARLNFGHSSCQIEGLYVPVADMNLAAGEGVYFTHHILLWKEPAVTITTMSMKGGWKRLLGGLPLIMTQAHGPGHIAFSRDAPGEMVALPLHPGQAVDVREHLFLTATLNVAYDCVQTGVFFTTGTGNDTEYHYPVGLYMDRFQGGAEPGLLLLHAAGNVFIRNLGPGDTLLIKPTALIFKDPTVDMHLHFEHPAGTYTGWGSWGSRYIWLRVVGPGRVAVQSVFEHVEGEKHVIQTHSAATRRRW